MADRDIEREKLIKDNKTFSKSNNGNPKPFNNLRAIFVLFCKFNEKMEGLCYN